MVKMHHISFRADDRSYFSLIKKDIQKLVIAADFSPRKIAEVDIIVSEITSNLSKHADHGEIIVKVDKDENNSYLEILCIDDGPGIGDINKVMTDGYSSVNTLGQGLGSIKRLSDQFDIYSVKKWGTILLSRVYMLPLVHQKKKKIEVYPLIIPKPGQNISGDGYCYQETAEGFKILIADGLGHGRDAHQAVKEACKAFSTCVETIPSETIRVIHSQIRKTRGIVGIVIFFNENLKTWTVAGVGNIACKWFGGPNIRTYFSYNGIIGHNIPTSITDTELMRDEFQQFICCSDGILTRWDSTKFPLIYKHNPLILAAAIYKDFGRKTDDMSVIVCKSF